METFPGMATAAGEEGEGGSSLRQPPGDSEEIS